MDDQNLILRTVIQDDYKLEKLNLLHHTLAENVRKGWFQFLLLRKISDILFSINSILKPNQLQKTQESILMEQEKSNAASMGARTPSGRSKSKGDSDWLKWTKSRSRLYNENSVRRFVVPPDRYAWTISFKDYKPVNFTDKSIAGVKGSPPPPFADPANPNEVPLNKWDKTKEQNRMTHQSQHGYVIENGYPLIPIGRTGITGRGLLAQWGPNHAVDPIITRFKKSNGVKTNVLEWIAIQRADTGEWSIPGGIIRDREAAYDGNDVKIKSSCLIRIVTSKIFGASSSEERFHFSQKRFFNTMS